MDNPNEPPPEKPIPRRTCRIFWNRGGKAVETERLWISLPCDTAAKFRSYCRLTGEMPSGFFAALIEGYGPDPGMYPTAHELRYLDLKPDGTPELLMRVNGGFVGIKEMHYLRPLLAKLGCSPWRLFRHFIRTVNKERMEAEIAAAMADPELEDPAIEAIAKEARDL